MKIFHVPSISKVTLKRIVYSLVLLKQMSPHLKKNKPAKNKQKSLQKQTQTPTKTKIPFFDFAPIFNFDGQAICVFVSSIIC